MFNFKNISNWLAEMLVGTAGGKYVTPSEAIKYPAIWNAVNRISKHVGYLPLVCYRRLDNGGSEPAIGTAPYKLLETAPNSWQSPVIFKELMQAHCLLWGNAYAYIVRKNNRPVEMIPLYPGRTAPDLVQGEKLYLHLPDTADDPILKYRKPNSENYIVFEDNDIVHIQGFGFDGFAGVSVWKIASDSWSIGLESDNRIRSGFKNGFKAAMLLEAPPEAFRKEEDARQFINDFNEYHSGSDNADKAGLLTRGIKANVMQMNSQEAQMIEHRRYQKQDAALWFLLESMLGDGETSSYNSPEQKNLLYLQNCLMGWLVKWEQELNRKLLSVSSDRYYFKFQVQELLRADHKTQVETFALGINSRIYSPNEARAKMDMNPYDGGDEYANPAITPGNPGNQQEDDSPAEDEESPDDAEEDAQEEEEEEDNSTQSKAVRNVMSHMIEIECNRLVKHSKKDNPVEAIEKFYDKWVDTLANAVERVGGSRFLAETHCSTSRELLGSAFVENKEEDAPAIVARCIEDWDLRALDYGCK